MSCKNNKNRTKSNELLVFLCGLQKQKHNNYQPFVFILALHLHKEHLYIACVWSDSDLKANYKFLELWETIHFHFNFSRIHSSTYPVSASNGYMSKTFTCADDRVNVKVKKKVMHVYLSYPSAFPTKLGKLRV